MVAAAAAAIEPPKLSRTDWGLHWRRSDCSRCRMDDDDDADDDAVVLEMLLPSSI